MSKLYDLKEALEGLFMSGADDEHDGSEMLELLDPVDYAALLNVLADRAGTLYAYAVSGEKPYRGKPLVEDQASILWVDPKVTVIEEFIVYQHCTELWLLSDMTFLVTSCFRTSVPGHFTSVYRTVKGMFPAACDIHIDFVDLSNFLTYLPELYRRNNMPIYEL